MHVDCWLVDHDIERDTETQKGKGSFNLTKPIFTLGSFFCYFQAPDCFQWDLPALSKATVLPASGRIRRGTWRNASLGAIPPLFGGNRATRTKTYHANFLVGNLEMLFPITPKKNGFTKSGANFNENWKKRFRKEKMGHLRKKKENKTRFQLLIHSCFNLQLEASGQKNRQQVPRSVWLANRCDIIVMAPFGVYVNPKKWEWPNTTLPAISRFQRSGCTSSFHDYPLWNSETNIAHLKIGDWNMIFLLERFPKAGAMVVSGRVPGFSPWSNLWMKLKLTTSQLYGLIDPI